jgi:GT2 family glycosyltransferase
MTVAIVITNFNMPERTDALCDSITKRVNCDYELIVVDNGSNIAKPSPYTRVQLFENIQTTRGWLAGLDYADKIGEFDYYLFLITSAEFDYGAYDPIRPMVEFMDAHPEAVGIHPALTKDSTTSWSHLITRGGGVPRKTWMIDNICSMYRADWFNSIGRFDKNLTYAWGIDLETCYKARKQGRSLWVHEGVKVKKVTNIGYSMDRMCMTADDRAQRATENMSSVLTPRYGCDYFKKLTEDYVNDSMR